MSSYDGAVLAWADHLRSGGTTPWDRFWPAAPGSTVGGVPLGATQLELVRRLAERWSGPGFGVLADRVVHREPPGRGMARILPLAHPDAPRGFGAPPVDPSDVPAGELIRLGIGLLSDLTVARPAYVAPKQRRRLRLARPPRQVEISSPTLEGLLTEAWSARIRRGGEMPWRRFARSLSGRDVLPLAADTSRLAAQAARRVGPENVHVYVGAAARHDGAFDVEATELLRRLNPVLSLHVEGGRLDGVRGTAVHLLSGGPARPLAVPAQAEDWKRGRAERIAQSLSNGGYSVHGDLEEYVAGVHAPRGPRPAAVLDRLLDVVVRTVREEQR